MDANALNIDFALASRSVGDARGAPMGRRNFVLDPLATVYLGRVRFVDGDYDAGGAYWGAAGGSLFCATDVAARVQIFVRSPDWKEAKRYLHKDYPSLHVVPAAPPDDRVWWTTGSGYVALEIGVKDAKACAHSGDCSLDVEALSKEPYIARQLAELRFHEVRDTLRDTGGWALDELDDHAQNLQRLLWIACCDISEDPEAYQ